MDRVDLEQWKPKEVARLLALVETERRYYQEIVANVPVGFLIVNQDQIVLSANKYFRTLAGTSLNEILRRRVEEVLPFPGLQDRIKEALSTMRPQERIAVQGRVGSQERSVYLSVQPLQGWELDSGPEALLVLEDIVPAGTVAEGPSVVDTTAAPVEPVALPEPAAEVLEPIPAEPEFVRELEAIVWESDPMTLIYSYVNERAEEWLGYPVIQWTTEEDFWKRHVDEEDRPRVADFYRRAAENGTSHVCEYRVRTDQNALLWVRTHVRVQRDENGRAIKFTGVTVDITQRRAQEQQSQQAHKVDALGRLARQVAHDFNNLLMIISGYSEELRNSLPVTSPLHHDMGEILRATERVQLLTGQLQQYSRRPSVDLKYCSMNLLLGSLEDRLRQEAGNGIEVRIDAQADQSPARVDAVQMEHVLLSLVRQARSEMRGLGRLNIATADLEISEDYGAGIGPAPGSYLLLTLSTSGPGLDNEQQDRLFEPWLIADESGREESLALVQAYNTVRQFGGDLALWSEPGQGVSIRLYLPRSANAQMPADLPPLAPTAPVASPTEAVSEPTALETILVVEDEAGIRALVRKILRRQGYTVLEAGNGDEALQVCAQQKGRIDLLVTDVMMPLMSGRELADRLLSLRPELRVLYVSGYTDDAMLQSGSFPPGTAFLQKPFTLGSLLGKVREVLDLRQGKSAGY